jgi:serine/threonine protein kinase
MTSERWQRIDVLFHAALARGERERAGFLQDACGGDDALRRDVESLVAQAHSASGFLATPLPAISVAEPDSTALIGRRLGPYQIEALIGAGGMGEVYRARDTKLGRDVAVKILRGALASEPERLARFEREARVLASLNHPHIGAIYGFEDADGVRALVLELIEGETLADRISRGAVPLHEIITIARQIADALEASHEKGIIHRDLKPANIKITPEGVVKVLDFGLAKLPVANAGSAGGSQLATQMGATREGTVLGTAAYMSPEQARGQAVDKRTDIWAFGCVMYEMLIGRAVFQRATFSDTVVAILERDPDWSLLPATTPPGIRRLLQRCLEKDAKRRLRDIGEARLELETRADPRTSPDPGPEHESALRRSPESRSKVRLLMWAGVPVLLLIVGLVAWRDWPASPGSQPLRAIPLIALPGVARHPSFSPDGNHVAFTWSGAALDNSDVYVQQIGSGAPLRLTTDPARDYSPAWSPDGRWVAFLRDQADAGRNDIRLVPPLGGSERKLGEIHIGAELLRPVSLAWCPDTSCVVVTDSLADGRADALFSVTLDSGERRQLTRPDDGTLDLDPAISPDGKWLVFSRHVTPVRGELYLLPLGTGVTASGEARRLTDTTLSASDATWMPDSKEVLFSAKGSLWRLGVDGASAPSRLPFVGEDGLTPAVSNARSGQVSRLIYVRSYQDQNIWRVVTSAPGGPVASPPAVAISSTRVDLTPEFSPDGRRVAFTSARSGELEIWVANPDGSATVQLTSMNAVPGFPRWSPDGNTIVFHSDADGQAEAYAIPAAGGKPRNITSHPSSDSFPSFSSDGRWVYFDSNRDGDDTIWKIPSSGGRATPVTKGPGMAAGSSADGAFLYYIETFVRSSPLWRMPAAGGAPTKVLDGVVQSNFKVLERGVYYIQQSPQDAGAAGINAAPGDAELRYFDFATQSSKRVAGHLGPVGLGLTASPDGRTILYTRTDPPIDDLMLVENFR